MAQTPVDDFQQSLTLTQYFPLNGVFPARGGGGTGFFLGEIGIFAGTFDPAGDLAAGQLLTISQNTAIFSILGTTYGGNGTTNFALPNLQGAAMLGEGQGTGLPRKPKACRSARRPSPLQCRKRLRISAAPASLLTTISLRCRWATRSARLAFSPAPVAAPISA